MIGSRVTTSWASSIVGDSPPPRHARRPPREAKAQDQVTIYMPRFIGRSKPELYIDWEYELNAITSRENLICGAPVFIFCGAWVVCHIIFATKIRILWCTSTCATEIRHSVAHHFICATEIRHSMAHEY
jgi:hypothetical protein